MTFDQRYTLDMGDGRRLELAYHGPNHQPGNLFIHVPTARTLMLVDVIYPGWVPFDLLAVSSDIPGWVSAYDRALAYDFETFVGGHVGRPGNRADVELARDYIRDLERAALAALRANPRPAVIGRLGKKHGFDNPWWLVDQHTTAVVAACAREMVEGWGGRLGGVEVYAESHCKRMQFSLRID